MFETFDFKDETGHRIQMLDGCGKVIQIFIFIFNFVILLLGLGLAGVSIWTLVENNHIDTLLNSNIYVTASGILLATGVVISIVSFLGCCGAIRGVKCLLATYFVVLLLIFVLLVVGAVFGYLTKDKIKEEAEKKMLDVLTDYNKKQYITDAWDYAQSKLGCCGVIDYQDWKTNIDFQRPTKRVPESCCREKFNRCETNPIETNTFFAGCLTLVEKFIVDHAVPLAAVSISILVVMIIAMILSCSLYMML